MQVPHVDDFHTHLRSGCLMHAVCTSLNDSGVRSCFVMVTFISNSSHTKPNLIPPISTTAQALAYKSELESICPDIEFFMSLYLSAELDVEEVRKAAKAGIKGIKSYPKGVTTNSSSGIEDYSRFYHIFEVMQETGLVLNLHGEMPSNEKTETCVLNAEAQFLPQLKILYDAFPRLKIVLEHATTSAAVEMVKSLGSTVGCTITLHHLALTCDDWTNNIFNFCKPVAKLFSDRAALREVVKSGHPRFFLGSDSAPHTLNSKVKDGCAGVYTGASVPQYLAHILDTFDALDQFVPFASENGRRFYGMDAQVNAKLMTIVKREFKVTDSMGFVDEDGEEQCVVPFMAGQVLTYDIVL